MAASTKVRPMRNSKTVDEATRPLDHGFQEPYTTTLGKDWRVDVRTIHDRETLEAALPEPERRRLRQLVAEYKADRPNPLRSWRKFRWLRLLFGWLIAYFDRPRSYANVNASGLGGGVKILLQDTVALMRAEDLDVEWDVLGADLVAFTVTKCIHNDLQGKDNPPLNHQYNRFVRGMLIALLWGLPFIGRYGRFPLVFEGVARKGNTLTRTSRLIYRRWHVRLWRKLRWRLAGATDVWIHDWQPALCIYKMRGWNLHAIGFRCLRLLRGRSTKFNLFFRDHIDTNRDRLAQPGPARDAWLYMLRFVRRADRFVVHPVGPDKCQNVPYEIPLDMALGLPAISSLLEGTNEDMTEEQIARALALLNRELLKAGMAPIDMADIATLVGQVSRYDPAKRMDWGLAIVARSIEIMLELGYPLEECPQLIQLGNGAGDDRDGRPVHQDTLNRRNAYDPLIARRLRVLRLGHCDALKNLVLRLIKVLIHPADSEGWEDFISCAIFHLTPAFVGDNAGPAEQVVDYESGRVLPVTGSDVVEIWARALVEFFTHPELRARMKERTAYWAEHKNIEFTEGFEVISVLWLCLEQSRNPQFAGGGRKIRDHVVADERYADAA